MNSSPFIDNKSYQAVFQNYQTVASDPISYYPRIDHSKVHSVVYPLDISRGATQLIYGNDISLAVIAGSFIQYLVTNSTDVDDNIIKLVNKNFWDLLA